MRTDFKAILLITVLLGIFSVNCFAAIPSEQTTLDIYQIAPVAPEAPITQQEVAAIIPTDIPEGASQEKVGKMVLDKALKSALKSDFVKSSAVGQTADNIKDGINTEMAIGGPSESSDPDAIQHKIKFKLDPIQTRAKVQYSGIVDAAAIYENGDTKFEITEDFESYQVKVSHTIKDTEALSLFQVQWGW